MSPKKVTHKLDEQYRHQFQNFQTETYRKIISDRTIALEYAKSALEKIDPAKYTPDNVEKIADILESVARIILKQREEKSKKRVSIKH